MVQGKLTVLVGTMGKPSSLKISKHLSVVVQRIKSSRARRYWA